MYNQNLYFKYESYIFGNYYVIININIFGLSILYLSLYYSLYLIVNTDTFDKCSSFNDCTVYKYSEKMQLQEINKS